MARHFLQLYLLIVVTLAVASWGQDRLWEAYAPRTEDPAASAVLRLVAEQLETVAPESREAHLARLRERAAVDLELFSAGEIAGADMAARVQRGEPAVLVDAADERVWMLRKLDGDDRVLVYRFMHPQLSGRALDWALALLFYAAIALVIMLWLWPLTRDLRALERSATAFGDRNWHFDAQIGSRSPVAPLAEAFKRMAARIDGLIRSQRDMTNALSHEIKTPLSRMRFEIEMARMTSPPPVVAAHLDHLDTDVAELDAFVAATLEYAILERGEVVLNRGAHDFTVILPELTESARRSAPAGVTIECSVDGRGTNVWCDAHLMETVLRNLVYNALRYARTRVRVAFDVVGQGSYRLRVDDDGPGIPHADRERVFGSFVQLEVRSGEKRGYGLGLAIVKRLVEWHGGTVAVHDADLGGARFEVLWQEASLRAASAAVSQGVSRGSA